MSDTVETRLARIETKLDTILDECPKCKERLRAVETWQTKAAAVLALLGLAWVPVCALLVRYAAKGLGL